MASVGIVGGLGVGATVHYYERIAAACKARGVVPDLVIVHADVDYGQGLVRAGKLDGWFALFAPAGTPQPIIDKLNAAMRKIARMDVTMQRANQLGTVLKDWSPAEMDKFARSEVAEWGKVIRDNNITID